MAAMILEQVYKDLVVDEGIRLVPYYCTAGKLTVGAGHNLTDRGLTPAEREHLNYKGKGYKDLTISTEGAYYLLDNDVKINVYELKIIFSDLKEFPDEVQHVLINMYHQLGYSSFRGFYRFIDAIKNRHWKIAAMELRDSKLWRKDSPKRAERLAKRLEKVK